MTDTAQRDTTPTGARSGATAPLHRLTRSAAVAAVAGLVGVAVLATALLAGGEDEERPVSAAPAPVAQEAEPQVVQGLQGVPGFPIRMTVPPSLFEVDEDGGSRAFRLKELPHDAGTIVLTGLEALVGTTEDLPQDVAAALRSERPDLVVTDVRPVTVAGVRGQSFQLELAAGAPRTDVWCPIEERLCFKLAPGFVTDVTVLPLSPAPLWIAVDHRPEHRERMRQAAQELLASLRFS